MDDTATGWPPAKVRIASMSSAVKTATGAAPSHAASQPSDASDDDDREDVRVRMEPSWWFCRGRASLAAAEAAGPTAFPAAVDRQIELGAIDDLTVLDHRVDYAWRC